MAGLCDHGLSRRLASVNDLTVVNSFLSTYIRCWRCDLRIRVGWRWNFRSVGHALNSAESKGLI